MLFPVSPCRPFTNSKTNVRRGAKALNAGTFRPVILLLLAMIFFQGCDSDDPTPVNEEELITTVEIILAPEGGGDPVSLKFFDADGEQGSIAPLVTVSGPLKASTTYSAAIVLKNEAVNPVADITDEVAEEADQHLFCFDASGGISIQYDDEDVNGLRLGILTTWTTGVATEADVTISLRHQPGTKTGECPGAGETDVEVAFSITVE
jgi:hypothetical protein